MATPTAAPPVQHSELKRSITAKQLYFYVVGDVLGSGIYVLVGLVAAAVGGAFWMAFLVGVAIATVTGLAYAELVTKYPRPPAPRCTSTRHSAVRCSRSSSRYACSLPTWPPSDHSLRVSSGTSAA